MRTPLPDNDYELTEGAAWLNVKGFAIRINSTDEGIVVDVFDDAKARRDGYDDALVATTYAFDNELGEDD